MATVAFLAPFSATRLAGPLTLGRAVALGLAATLALYLFQARPIRLRPDRSALCAAVAYAGLVGWVFLNSLIWGCNCDGKLGGFAEFAFVGLSALVALALEPRLRRVALGATLAGLGLAAVLALLGVGSINSGTVDLTQTGGRLSGTFGNANELAFALALAVPICLAYLPRARGRLRAALVALVLVLSAALVLTYSRGGIIAAAAGALAVALWSARGDRRRLRLIVAASTAVVIIAAVLYSTFERGRREASFAPVPTALRPLDQRDLSGWDSRGLGPIPRGPSRLSNRPSGIAVGSRRAGEGASFRWGEAARRGAYVLDFRARAVGHGLLAIRYALGEPDQASAGALGKGSVGARWRRFELTWHPRRRAPHAALYVWQESGPSTLLLADVRIEAKVPDRAPRPVAVAGRLKGSIYGHLTARAAREEGRFVRSRLEASRLAVRAFGSSPLWGIGWATFPDYAARHLDYGQLAAHDEYLSFAAELGLIGLGLLGLLVAAAVLGVMRSGATPPETAAIGMLAAAAAGMVFVEVLPVPQLSIPVAMALAVVCGRRRAG